MDQHLGLRERKKQRTRETISNTAIALFIEHGFDPVSITQVADAAEVSRRTLFSYFPAKEDLVVHRFADHEDESARVVRARPADQTPLDALRANFLDGLRRHDPITGISDNPEVIAIYELILDTPALYARIVRFFENSERMLVAALRETDDLPELTARLIAAQISAVQRTLALDNFRRAVAGTTAADAYPDALAAAELGFNQLRDGLG
ncbi:TetR family transcriptional regulator [Saccharopolyspora hirsuta]|uniref:TetR family transcriptional regulator n=1 Tax=Saccharopolyspora hirsuta TaxID=1837 RepID=A0A5M7BUN4_SACHI|nr:TetR family transcriptional regulator [Saccharopolyspora hirsuta]KAA5832840.1 TetR family transcriptional regulator [Saccharopolyspora hirsuta]